MSMSAVSTSFFLLTTLALLPTGPSLPVALALLVPKSYRWSSSMEMMSSSSMSFRVAELLNRLYAAYFYEIISSID